MQLRDYYKKQAVKHSSQTQWELFRKTRNNVNSEIRLAKKKYFCDKINECAQINNPRKSWSLINDLLGKKRKSNNITELHVNDVIISEDNLIAETFNNFFIHIGSELASEIDAQLPNENDAEGNINNNISLLNTFEFSAISEEEVYTKLCNLKEAKSTGIDTIPARILKISANIIAPSITWIFNLSLKKGIFVDEWKKAWVLPIYKSGNRYNCENYRHISILPVISKILEGCVFNQLYNFLNKNSLLSKHQFGFRPKNSTLTALIQMCDEFYQNLDNGKLNGVVFLDIRKAFDSVDHKILLCKMKTIWFEKC